MDITTTNQPDPGLLARLRAMPKVEIHVHLEGATDAATVWQMAARNGVRLPARSLEEWGSFYAFRDFNHFIEVDQLAGSCMRTPEDFAFMTERFLEIQAAQNIRYTEAFLSASLLVEKLPTPELLAAFSEGLRLGEERHGVRCRFIPDIARHQPETQWRVLDFVNYRLKVTPEDRPHPIRALFDAGVRVTVNSDDPPMFSTDLNQEYALLAAQGFTWDELVRLNLNAVDVCYLPEDEKDGLRRLIADC